VHDLSVFDDRLPGDDRVVGRYRPAPQQRFDRVAQRTGKTGAVDSPANEVSHRARPQHPELALAAEAGRTSERRSWSASRAPVAAAPERCRARSIAVLASSQREAESVDAEPSQPSPTGAPARQ